MSFVSKAKQSLRKRGSILLYTVVVLIVVGTTVLALTAAVTENVQTVRRSEARLQAFYGAEAGIQQVIHWFNKPGNSPDSDYFQPLASGDLVDDDGTSVLVLQNRGALEIPAISLPALEFTKDGKKVQKAKLISLLIEPPENTDPKGVVCRVTSVARTNPVVKDGKEAGVDATVMALLSDNDLPELIIEAALTSEDTGNTASNGQFNVHWGEIWTKGDIKLNNPMDKKFPTISEDKWFAAKTEAHLRGKSDYADGNQKKGFSSTPLSSSSPLYKRPYKAGTAKYFTDHDNLHQHQNLPFPDLSYEKMKLMCLENGFPIYRSASGGKIIVGKDEDGEDILMGFSEFFNDKIHTDPDQVDRTKLPPIYFIDTMDGQAPNSNNMTTFKESGGGNFSYGYFFIAANLDFGGAGNPPTYNTPINPDHEEDDAIPKLRHYGLLYTYGVSNLQGQNNLYGAIYSESGFAGGGTWDIWYDVDLKDPRRGKLGSKVKITMWNTTFGDEQFADLAVEQEDGG